jgi:uncharacterized membrane protein
MSKSIWLSTFLFFVMKFVTVTATDDDDDLGEVVVDLMIGFGMAICEEFVACKLFMIIAGLVGVLMMLIGLFSGEISCDEFCNRRTARRGFTTGLGYGLTRSFRS